MSDLSARFATFVDGLSDDDAVALLDLIENRVTQNKPGTGEIVGGEIVAIEPRGGMVCATCSAPTPPGTGYASPYQAPRKFVYLLGIRGVEETEKVVCRDCYRADFARVYPNERVPV